MGRPPGLENRANGPTSVGAHRCVRPKACLRGVFWGGHTGPPLQGSAMVGRSMNAGVKGPARVGGHTGPPQQGIGVMGGHTGPPLRGLLKNR